MRFYNHQHQYYCGIDLHVKTMDVCRASFEQCEGGPAAVLREMTMSDIWPRVDREA